MTPLHLFSLGQLRLQRAGEDLLPGRRKELALLVYLAYHAPRKVPRAALAALLWGEKDEARARQSLRQALLKVRRVLGEAAIEITAESARVDAGAVILDVALFESDLAAGQPAAALARWRGDFLVGFEEVGGEEFRIWLEADRERLRRRATAALEQLVIGAEERGEWGAAVAWAERWVEIEHLSEPAHRRLIEALRLGGRPDEAAALHAAFLARHRSELGTDPSPEFLLLERPAALAPWEAGRGAVPLSSALFSPDLVGRGPVFAQLSEQWQAVRRGGAAVVVVEGEEGIGKTRLCEEFLRWVEETSGETFVLRARAYEAERQLAWTAARDLLAGLASAPGLSGVPEPALAEIGRLAPAIRDRFPQLPDAQRDEAGLIEAVQRVLADVTAEVPLVLFLDDFPAADEPTQRLLLSLARRPPASLLLLLTARTDAAHLSLTLEPLREIPEVRRLSLQRLSAAEVEALLDSMLVLEPGQRRGLALRLHGEGEGIPFYTIALVSALADAGHLAPDTGGVWQLAEDVEDGALPLPRDIREAVRARLEHLSPGAREVVGAAAVLGRTLDPALLEAVAGQPPAAFCEAIEELIARRLLREAPPHARGYEFTHDLIRRVAYELLGSARQQLLQRSLALALDGEPAGEGRHHSAAEPPHPRTGLSRAGRRIWTWRWAAVLLAMVVPVLAAAALWSRRPGVEVSPVLAIGAIDAAAGTESQDVSRALQGLLASGLAQVPELRVISTERMYEVRAQLAGSAAVSPMAIARAAGADELITGTLNPQPDGGFRLELRQVDLRTGMLRGTLAVEGAGAGELVAKVVASVAGPLGVSAPLPAATAYRARPVGAQQQYQEGLAAFYRGDLATAEGFFTTALAYDSSFALAAYYAWRTRSALGSRVSGDTSLTRALRWIDDAPEPERLLTRALWADALQDPSRFVLAESLATRYPHEPEGHLLLGRAKGARGNFLGAIPHLRRVIIMDSLGLEGRSIHCRACDAYSEILDAFALADSSAAGLRWVREWTERQPTSARAWNALADQLLGRNLFSEALAAKQTALSLRPGSDMGPIFPSHLALRSGDWATADRILRQAAEEATDDVRTSALWWLTISLREQGRLREALEAARRYRARVSAAHASAGLQPRAIPYTAVLEAQVLFELGRFQAASALFDSIAAASIAPESRGWTARAQAWTLTHQATALAYAADTAALAPLAERVRAVGSESGYGRDWRLHHYVRGLLLAQRGRTAEAEREFRRAIYSVPSGFSRINLELARTLLALGRANEAVAMLEAALRGPLEASGLYLTRTELHLELGKALEQAGHPERAVDHYRWVLQAWERADPSFHGRRERARQRLSALGG